MGVLEWLGANFQIVTLVVLTLEGELLSGPGLQDDLKILFEPSPAFGEGRVERVMMVGKGAPSDPEVQPTLADMVQSGGFLSDPNRIVQRQQQHAETQPDPLGTHRQGGGYNERSGQDAERGEMVFGQPNRVHTHALRLVDECETLGECLLICVSVRRGELKEKSELHEDSQNWH